MGKEGVHSFRASCFNVSVALELTPVVSPVESNSLFGLVLEDNMNLVFTVVRSESTSSWESWASWETNSISSSVNYFFVSSFVNSVMFSSSFVVEAFMGKDWTLHTSDNSEPLMCLADLTSLVRGVDKSSSEESACSMALPHIVGGFFTTSNSALRKSFGGKRCWESPLLENIERSADSWTSWNAWSNWNFASIFDPFTALESVPDMSNIFEYISTVMPVALVPFPVTMSESSLGWAPVVPLAIIVSVPDAVMGDPSPPGGWWFSGSTPVANFLVSSVSFDEMHTCSLSAKNLSVLGINCSFSLAKVSLIRVFMSFLITRLSFFELKFGLVFWLIFIDFELLDIFRIIELDSDKGF